jgi:hypothetical protein
MRQLDVSFESGGTSCAATVYQPDSPSGLMWRSIRGALTRGPVVVPLAGPPRSFALIAAPEALPRFERFRPVQKADQIRGVVLVQAGDRNGMAPPRAIEKLGIRAPHAELARYPIDHFGCCWPEHIDQIAGDQLEFLRRHVCC